MKHFSTRLKLCCFLLFQGLLLSSAAALAQSTIYVNASTGNDSYDGTSASVGTFPVGPKKTIQAGINTVDNHGKIIIENVAPFYTLELLTINKNVRFFKTGAAGALQVSVIDLQNGSDMQTAGGNFTTGTNWSGTPQWTIAGGVATHNTGNTTPLTYIPSPDVDYSQSTQVEVHFTLTKASPINGSVSVAWAGGSSTAHSIRGRNVAQLTIPASSSGSLQFVPTSDFDGAIDSVQFRFLSPAVFTSTNVNVYSSVNGGSSITQATQWATANSRIDVSAGTYWERAFTLNGIQLAGDSAMTTRIKASIGGAGSNYSVVSLTGSDAQIRSFSLTREVPNPKTSLSMAAEWAALPQTTLIDLASTNGIVERMIIRDGNLAINMSSASNMIVRNNNIIFNRQGIALNNGGNNWQIKNNLIGENWTWGIAADASSVASNITISENRLSNNWVGAIANRHTGTATINISVSNNFISSGSPVKQSYSSGSSPEAPVAQLAPAAHGGTASSPISSSTDRANTKSTARLLAAVRNGALTYPVEMVGYRAGDATAATQLRDALQLFTYLTDSTDQSNRLGFQPNLASLTALSTLTLNQIAAATPANATVNLPNGTYTESTTLSIPRNMKFRRTGGYTVTLNGTPAVSVPTGVTFSLGNGVYTTANAVEVLGTGVMTDSAGGKLVLANNTTAVSARGKYGRLEINGTAGAVVNTTLTVDSALMLTNGILDVNGLSLTIGGQISGTSTIKSSNTALILIAGTTGGSVGTIRFTPGFQTANQFTINRTGDGAAVTLGSPLTVNLLSLTNGVIMTDATNKITVNGTTFTGGNASSFVNGPLTFTVAGSGANTFTLPVGSIDPGKGYRPITLTNVLQAFTTSYTAEVVNTSAQALGHGFAGASQLNRVSNFRYWNVSASTTPTSIGSVTVAYTSTDFVIENSYVRLAQRQGGSWYNLGGTGASPLTSSGTNAVSTSLGLFALGNVSPGSNFGGDRITIFVNGSTGNDLNSGFSAASAKRSVLAGLAAFPNEGGMLVVTHGVYNEDVTASRKITFKGTTGTGTTAQVNSLTLKYKAQYVVPAADVNTGTDQINVGADHNLAVDDTVVYMKNRTDQAIGGLTPGTTYMVHSVSGNLITLKNPGGSLVDLTSAGSGNHVVALRLNNSGFTALQVIAKQNSDVQTAYGLTADAGTLTIDTGTWYYAQVNVAKPITIKGAGASQTILDNVSPAVSGTVACFTLGAGVNNININNLAISNYQQGVYRTGAGNSMSHVLRKLTLTNNLTYGIAYDNSGSNRSIMIDSCTIDGVTATGGRGILFQNGSQTSITVCNNNITGVSAAGIEITGSALMGATVRSNTLTGQATANKVMDAGIIVAHNGSEHADSIKKYSVAIENNNVTVRGRLGIEVRGGRGNGAFKNGGSFVVSGNTVTLGSGAPYTMALGNENRDVAGIAIGKIMTASTPSGVVVTSNTVSNFAQRALQFSASPSLSESSTGFGIVASGQDHKIQNNVITGCNVGVQVQRGLSFSPASNSAANAESACGDNYFGRDVTTGTTTAMVAFNKLTGNSLAIRAVGEVMVNGSGNYYGSAGNKSTDPTQKFVSVGVVTNTACSGNSIPGGTSIAGSNSGAGKLYTVCWAVNDESAPNASVPGFQTDYVVSFRDTATFNALGLMTPAKAVLRPFDDLSNYAWSEVPTFKCGITLSRTSTGAITLNGAKLSNDSILTIASGTTFVINNDTLDCGNRGRIAGDGNLTFNTGAVFQTANGKGCHSDSTMGVAGTITWGAEPRFSFNGTYLQTTGNMVPEEIHSLRVHNNVGVQLSNDHLCNGVVDLARGYLDINTKVLTLSGTITGTDSLRGGDDAGLIIGGNQGGDCGLIKFKKGYQEVALLTVQRLGSNGRGTLGTDLEVSSFIVNTNGYLDLNGNKLKISGGGLGESFSCKGGVTYGTPSGTVEYTNSGDLLPGLSMLADNATLSKLIVNSDGGSMKLTAAAIVGDELQMKNGRLKLNGQQLTLSGTTLFESNGMLEGSATSKLVIAGTGGSLGQVKFVADSLGRCLSQLNINRAGGDGHIASRLIIVDTLYQTDGQLIFDAPSLTLAGCGKLAAGELVGNPEFNLYVRGTDAGTLRFAEDSHSVKDLRLEITDTLRMASDFNVNGVFTRKGGMLDTKRNMLTLAGSQADSMAYVKTGPLCRLTIAGSNSAFGKLPFRYGHNSVKEFQIQRLNGSARCYGDLTVLDSLVLGKGTLHVDTNTFRLVGRSFAYNGNLAGGTYNNCQGFIEVRGSLGESAGTLLFKPGQNSFRTFRMMRFGLDAAVVIGSDVLFRDTLTLDGGIVYVTGDNVLTVGTGTTTKGICLRTSGAVSGNLGRYFAGTNTGLNSGLYPLGNQERYCPVTMEFSHQPDAEGHLVMRFVPGAMANAQAFPPGGLYEGSIHLNRVSTTGYWEAAPGGPQPMTCTTCKYSGTFVANNYAGVNNFAGLVLVKRQLPSENWMLSGTHVTTTGSNSQAIAKRDTMPDFFGQYAIAADSLENPLPVNLMHFNANAVAEGVQVRWITAMEKNVSHFEVERSYDNREFKTVAQQEAAGNTAQRRSYNYLDREADKSATVAYYRLKMVDRDGTFEYSPVAAVKMTNSESRLVHNLFPNPAKSGGYVNVMLNSSQRVQMEILNLHGKTLSTRSIGSTEHVELGGLAAGVYLFRFTDGNSTHTERVEIQ